jgi:cellulose synthase/poly-beta-1,6-N-acetylglucosamine synthase-like glycosyltransferase
MVLGIVGGVFLLGYAFLMHYYKHWWDKLPLFEPVNPGHFVKVSVVIAARNEEQNIQNLLESLASQTFSKEDFEIIIVDDHSTDATVNVIDNYSLQNLRLIKLDENTTSKKAAISAGVQNSAGELILITDADCVVPPNWIQAHVDFYKEEEVVFIAAPVKYDCNKSLLQIFQTIDFLTLQGITAASVSANFHSMCNGANLAYTKNAFNAVNGFAGIDKVASGDDMLLMYKIWKQNPEQVKYLKSKDAIVTTKPMQTWKAFINQRIRWASKTSYYDDKRVFWSLLLVYLTNLFFIVFFIAAFFDVSYLAIAFMYVVLKTAIELPFVYSVSKFYSQQHLMRWFFFLQPLHITYIVVIGFISQLGTYEWKGRRTK